MNSTTHRYIFIYIYIYIIYIYKLLTPLNELDYSPHPTNHSSDHWPGAVVSMVNCTGPCLARHDRWLFLARTAAAAHPKWEVAAAYLHQMRLLYPRRAFASTRFADR